MSLYVNGKKSARVRSALRSPCSSLAMIVATWEWIPEPPYHRTMARAETSLSGRVKGVQLAIAEDAESIDHLVSPEDAIRIAMARQ